MAIAKNYAARGGALPNVALRSAYRPVYGPNCSTSGGKVVE